MNAGQDPHLAVDGSRENSPEGEPDLTPLFLFSVLTTLLRVDALVPNPPAASPTSSDGLSHLPCVPPLHRAALLCSPHEPFSDRSTTMLSARLYLLDAISRLVARHHEQDQLAALSAARTRHQIREATFAAEHNKFRHLENRLREVERKADEDARRTGDRASRDRLMRERVSALEDEVDRLSLGARRTRAAGGVGTLSGAVPSFHWRSATAAAAFVLGVAVGVALATAGGSSSRM